MAATPIKSLAPGQLTWRKLRSNILAMFGLVILLSFMVITLLAPVLAPYGRDTIDMAHVDQPPSVKHLLGTDELGRDVLSRLLYGGQVSMGVGVAATFFQLVIGVTLGSLAGYYGSRVDSTIMWVTDVIMCFPFFVIAISMAALLGPSVWNVILIIGILEWTAVARIVRGRILSLRSLEFVEAAKALGLSRWEIISRHLIPNTMGPIIVYATLSVAQGILAEASLSFLGLGVMQPQASWGGMMAAAQKMRVLQNEWWLWIPAGSMVLTTVLSINFLGDGLRDALDPQYKY